MNTPRYQHLRFHALKIGEDFFSGIQRYYKVSFFTGRTILDGELVVIMPWVKVRSVRPFGKRADCANNVYFGERTVADGQQVIPTPRPSFATAVGASAGLGAPTPYIIKLREELGREPQAVTPGGDRTPETIGGNELTPSA